MLVPLGLMMLRSKQSRLIPEPLSSSGPPSPRLRSYELTSNEGSGAIEMGAARPLESIWLTPIVTLPPEFAAPADFERPSPSRRLGPATLPQSSVKNTSTTIGASGDTLSPWAGVKFVQVGAQLSAQNVMLL